MKVLVFDNNQEAAQEALKIFKDTLKTGEEVFGLATGSTPEPVYAELRASDLDFSKATSVNLDEYYGLESDHPQSYSYYMNEQLFNHKPFKATFLPDGSNKDAEEETARYDEILANNTVDLQILGIGQNAHIGFNEPGTDFESTTQLVDLTKETIESNKRFFNSVDDVPRQAYSMGIKSIMNAKRIILLAFGENKAQAIKDAVEGPVTNHVPASILQNHDNVTLILDKEAASLLNQA